MNFVLATNHLGLGGSETYLITVAEQLDRLGHETWIYAPEPGAAMPVILERGLRAVDEAGLPEYCDGALVQDAGVSHQITARYPAAPQVFVAHSEVFDLQAPPQLDSAVAAVVALNDRVAERMRAMAVEREVVRLRQPIDTERFPSRGPLPRVPHRALLLGNNPHADRRVLLETACARAGLELVRVGGPGRQKVDLRPDFAAADIVIGYGRSILEAMASGRAAYVYDWQGGDGWVRGSSYRELESDGFAGRRHGTPADLAALVEDLGCYQASMGPVNHDLVMANHRANVHAQELVALFRRLGPPTPTPRAPLQEMARLVRLEWRARLESGSLIAENDYLRALLRQSEGKLRACEASTSWRLTAPLRALGRLARRVSGRVGARERS